MVFYSLLAFLVTVSLCMHMVNLQRITSFYVPRRASNQVDIECKYDVQGKKLYGVNWYKDGDQFFRCNGDGTVQDYPVEGVMIRHSGSARVGACPLTLIVLTTKSGGEYKCEVTLDTDGFPIDSRSSKLDFLEPSRKSDVDIVPKGSEKRTSQEESKSGCNGTSNTFNALLLLFMYFILI